MRDQSDAQPLQLPHGIEHLTIKGFKSFACLNRFPLAALNVLIGENGSGKSNFLLFSICWANSRQRCCKIKKKGTSYACYGRLL